MKCVYLLVVLALPSCSTELVVARTGLDSGVSSDGRAPDATPDPNVRDASADVDATTGVLDVDGGCGVVAVPPSTFVNVRVVTAAPPFLNRVDALTPGTYELEKYETYNQGPRGTGEVRELLVVTGSPTVGSVKLLREIRNVTGEVKAVPLEGATYTYAAGEFSANIRFEATCASGDRIVSADYEVQASTLRIYQPFDGVYREFKRVR
jgi:hypothetical protein